MEAPVSTIVAQATPPGRGGVGIVRVSGPLASYLAKKITHRTSFLARKAYFSSFFDETNQVVDQGLVIYFKAPHSFTGDDVVEFQGHGSPFVLDKLIKICVHFGAQLARPGEFSERAYLNNKLDLVQAEAIADLIAANSSTAARMAVRSLQGDFSTKINALNHTLINLRLYVEAAIDFPQEEIDFLSDGHIKNTLQRIIEDICLIRTLSSQGAIIREGLSIVIAGRPNAGKSTLINQLSQRDVAIVTDIPGTTRDVMRQAIMLDDIPLNIIDTAGLHASEDAVEQEGIKRAWQELKQADCVLMLIDITDDKASEALHEDILAILPQGIPVIKVFNHIDRIGLQPVIKQDDVYISAKLGLGIELLSSTIKKLVGYQGTEGLFLARRRHLQALDEALECLNTGFEQLTQHAALELLADDLGRAHQLLGQITGEFSADDLLGKIFSSFCIGK